MSQQKSKEAHLPVLLKEVLECLEPQPAQSYLDLTAGWGGHAATVLEITGAPERAVLVDRDAAAVSALKQRFSRAQVVHDDFLGALRQLAKDGRRFEVILADLGVSSPQLDEPKRGFSFSRAGPLDMRMDRRQTQSAEYLVNQASETELADILQRYGEEPRARRVALAIVRNRPIEDTAQLAAVISKASSFLGRRRIHPATKSFQAIRLAVNREIEQLEQGLPLALKVMAPGGRLAVISFHSLEDRLVKRFLTEHSGSGYDAELKLLTKKPIIASQSEIAFNPRARSAKLRAAAKIKNRKDERDTHAY